MKKAVCVFLAFCTVFMLCACTKNAGDMLSDINGKVKKIIDNSPVAEEIGTVINKRLKQSQIKKLKPAKVTPNGVTTLFYETLTKEQKTAYRYILTAANSMTSGWFSCGKMSDDYAKNLSVAYKAMLNDNPQIFWMPPSYAVAAGSGYACIAFKIDEKDLKSDYTMTKAERDRRKAILNAKSDELTAAAQNYSTDFERELFVHDYLTQNAVYNLDGGSMIYTSYGALADGVCVCEGYSRAMQLIMQRLSIKCGLIYGTYNNAGHIWNCINISGNWYHLDVTWDRSKELGTVHSFFNLTDSEIAESHVLSPMLDLESAVLDGTNYNQLSFECTDERENYYEKTGFVLTDDINQNINVISSAADLKGNKDSMEFKNKITGNEDDILNRTASALYPQLSLERYIISGKTVLIFFENSY